MTDCVFVCVCDKLLYEYTLGCPLNFDFCSINSQIVLKTSIRAKIVPKMGHFGKTVLYWLKVVGTLKPFIFFFYFRDRAIFSLPLKFQLKNRRNNQLAAFCNKCLKKILFFFSSLKGFISQPYVENQLPPYRHNAWTNFRQLFCCCKANQSFFFFGISCFGTKI